MELEPAGHRVLVKPEKPDQNLSKELKSIGFEIADPNKRRENDVIIGTIVAVGRNAWKAFDDGEPWAKVGDRVFYAKYGGFIVEHPETKELYRLVNDEDITIIVKGE